jgi:hypothetical protein
MENDIIEGYHIPKGATVIANIWYVLPYFVAMLTTDGICAGECSTMKIYTSPR